MARKSWVWKDPDPKTGEKGVIMMLRIYSYYKWKTKIVRNMAKVRRHYHLILGEHLEPTSPMYQAKFQDFYRTQISDFSMWFYATERSRDFVVRKSGRRAATIPHMRMPAVCYLINQNFWTPDPSINKDYDLMVCLNDVIGFKRPEWAMRLWKNWRQVYPNAKMVFVYSNVYRDVFDISRQLAEEAGGVDFVRSPDPESIRDFYRRSRFLVHPSKSESGPRVVAEAMSCGTPCILPSEPWVASVDHLRKGFCVLPKEAWLNNDGPRIASDFGKRVKTAELPKLVNTAGYLAAIDKKFSTFTRPWTLGKLRPPHFIGAHVEETPSERLFAEITGEVLT